MAQPDNTRDLIKTIKDAQIRIAENKLIIIKARLELLAQSDERGGLDLIETETGLWDSGCGATNNCCVPSCSGPQ